jgi:hypothetical protein
MMSSDFSTSIVLRSRLSAIFPYLDELCCFTDPLGIVVAISDVGSAVLDESDVLSDRSCLGAAFTDPAAPGVGGLW